MKHLSAGVSMSCMLTGRWYAHSHSQMQPTAVYQGKLRQQVASPHASLVRLPAQNRNAKDTLFEWLTHGGIPFNVCSPARLGRLEAILMPYLHFLLQYFIQGHFYRFPALVMSLELLHISMAMYTHMHSLNIAMFCIALLKNRIAKNLLSMVY